MIVIFQLFFTFSCCLIPFISPRLVVFLRKIYYAQFAFLGTTVVFMGAILFKKRLLKTVPYNYIALGLYTVSETGSIVLFCVWFDILNVIFALVAAIFTLVGLTLITCCTNSRPHYLLMVLIAVFFGSLPLGVLMIFFYPYYIGIASSVGIISVMSIYIVYDVYIIMDKNQLDYDDYVIGALLLYMDMISMVIRLIQGNKQEGGE